MFWESLLSHVETFLGPLGSTSSLFSRLIERIGSFACPKSRKTIWGFSSPNVAFLIQKYDCQQFATVGFGFCWRYATVGIPEGIPTFCALGAMAAANTHWCDGCLRRMGVAVLSHGWNAWRAAALAQTSVLQPHLIGQGQACSQKQAFVQCCKASSVRLKSLKVGA